MNVNKNKYQDLMKLRKQFLLALQNTPQDAGTKYQLWIDAMESFFAPMFSEATYPQSNFLII